MPTGYTSGIENGTITNWKDFLKTCVRAFGVAIDQRDSPLSVPLKVEFSANRYYYDEYCAAQKAYENALCMSHDDARNKMVADHAKRVSSAETSYKHYISQNELYQNMLTDINNWCPPTNEHEGIKEFAIDQIRKSMTSEAFINDLRKIANETISISEKSVSNYLSEYIEDCRKDVEIRYKQYIEEEKRVDNKRKFMKAFLDSLETSNIDGGI